MNDSISNMDEKGLLFGKWQVAADTWVITNRWKNMMYLLIGREKALLIDTGYGEGNLREFVEEITDKPVMVLNTHGHFDHTGGNAWWPEVWMAEPAIASARQAFSPMQEKWFSEKPYQDYHSNIICDGDKIDLGGRVVEIISIPAHSKGSVAILDFATRLLFTGDEIESGQVLLFASLGEMTVGSLVLSHQKNMEKLWTRKTEFDFLCPAHNGMMLNPKPYLHDFIALDKAILNGTAQIMPNTAGFGFAPDVTNAEQVFASFGKLERVQYGVASMIYTVE